MPNTGIKAPSSKAFLRFRIPHRKDFSSRFRILYSALDEIEILEALFSLFGAYEMKAIKSVTVSATSQHNMKERLSQLEKKAEAASVHHNLSVPV
mmetsp:Transcript_4790/g.10629  ORF Transcript_4790/g.10629 Transcript_4790/m.10629 type:complete len:95 (-) Transcript_4790:182-466(-)